MRMATDLPPIVLAPSRAGDRSHKDLNSRDKGREEGRSYGIQLQG